MDPSLYVDVELNVGYYVIWIVVSGTRLLVVCA